MKAATSCPKCGGPPNPKRGAVCPPCRSESGRLRYRDDPEYRERAKNRGAERRRERIAWTLEYFKTHPCIDCGETDPVVLEFDHVRGEKIAAISHMIVRGFPMATVEAEVEKCDVRCANCHRRQTARRGNWYSFLDAS